MDITLLTCPLIASSREQTLSSPSITGSWNFESMKAFSSCGSIVLQKNSRARQTPWSKQQHAGFHSRSLVGRGLPEECLQLFVFAVQHAVAVLLFRKLVALHILAELTHRLFDDFGQVRVFLDKLGSERLEVAQHVADDE